ncbi:MAG: hypothetical protein ACRCS9_05135 [Hyphomicrobium sp.]
MVRPIADVVAEAYRVFDAYRIGGDLFVCHCNCCMTEEVEHELVTTPLRQIPSSLLAEYTNSAHGYDDGRIATELRYFLPRYLELIAAADPPDTMGLDICLRRLRDADYRRNWPADEARVLDDFFEALMAHCVLSVDLVDWPAGPFAAFDIDSVLTVTVTAGGNLQRVLAAWEAAPDPAAALHMAEARTELYPVRGALVYHSAYFDDYFDAKAEIGAWLVRPEIEARIERAFFATADPRLQAVLSRGLG